MPRPTYTEVGALPPNVTAFRDRHGKLRLRWRKSGCPQHYFRSKLGTEAFALELSRCELKREDAHKRWIYFVQAGSDGPIKIGVATNVKARLCGLQTNHYAKLTLLATVRGGLNQERAYHRQFASYRLEGEWFTRHPDILAEIDRLTTPKAGALVGKLA